MTLTSAFGFDEETKKQADEAEALIRQGDLGGAEAIYLEVLDKKPGSLLALSNLGVVYYRQGRMLKAINTLEKAVEIAPTDGFSYRTLGMAYLKANELDLAVKALQQAIKLNRQDAKAHNFMAIVATKKGWWKTAESESRRAIELQDDYADAYFNLAVIYSSQSPPRKVLAIKAYRDAVKRGAKRSEELEQTLGITIP
ncbi:MAG: tetratricopeptide repeat protein [Verrucomicrobiota bacterium]